MQQGLIVNSYGRLFIVEVAGEKYQAVTKGKKTEFVVGDLVNLNLINSKQAQIIELLPRHSLIYRSDQNRSKIIASNLALLIIVIAVKPNFNINFLNSCLLCAESSRIQPLILINKTDLDESARFSQEIKALYATKLGYEVIELSALTSCEQLQPHLAQRRSLLIGQSGVGKSTITNQICPAAAARIGEMTQDEHSGRHTTTNASLYHVNASTDLIDCPGLQEFGLYHLVSSELAEYFPEMIPYLGRCKFSNCIHHNEPGCAIQDAHDAGIITPQRYRFYLQLLTNLQSKKHY